MVEFALILPLLLVFLLGVVDFGRIFTAGITMEAAARNAAEAAAQEYQQIIRNTPTPGPADYERIHDVALDELCREANVLPNRTAVVVIVNGQPIDQCTMPVAAVCVHDQSGGDSSLCGTTAWRGQAGVAVPAECGSIDGWVASTANEMPVNGTPPQIPVPYIEVRTCYHFTTLFNLHLQLPLGWSLNLGDIWIQRDRTFVVGDY